MNRRIALVCLAAVSLTAACRIGGSDQVEEVDADLLGGLNEPTAETSTPDGTAPPSTSTPGIDDIRGDRDGPPVLHRGFAAASPSTSRSPSAPRCAVS